MVEGALGQLSFLQATCPRPVRGMPACNGGLCSQLKAAGAARAWRLLSKVQSEPGVFMLRLLPADGRVTDVTG